MSDNKSYEHTSSWTPVRPTQETGRYMDDVDTTPVDYKPDLRNSNTPKLAWDREKPAQVSKRATPLYVHEVIESEQFLRQLKRDPDLALRSSLFADLDEEAIYEWYQHQGNWTNRLIHGDSAQIMASLATKEHLTGQVQMVYFDPPYGISFNSTMQVDASNRASGSSNSRGLSPEPEMVRVFRDTYKRGIHDYLDAIRANSILARSLLREDGSFFLQIGAENVHRIAVLLDEVFGPENRVATITFRKRGSSSASTLPEVADYILWYGKDREVVKSHHLYEDVVQNLRKDTDVIKALRSYVMLELSDGSSRELTDDEEQGTVQLPLGSRLFKQIPVTSQGRSRTGRSDAFIWQGQSYRCPTNSHWRVSHEGLERLAELNRLVIEDGTKNIHHWKQYSDEFPGTKLDNCWEDIKKPSDLHYVVETSEKIIERCLLMSTEPGDLVLDITCGSGTTPYVAEKWGRRWIATDASRVSIALARQRVLSGVHKWWMLSDSEEGIRKETELSGVSQRQPVMNSTDPAVGFVYKRVNYVSAGSLAYDTPVSFTYLVNYPFAKRGVNRIASPFTVESLSPYRTVSTAQYEDLVSSEASYDNIEEALRVSGCTLKSGERLTSFENFEPIADQAPLTHRCTMKSQSENDSQLGGGNSNFNSSRRCLL